MSSESGSDVDVETTKISGSNSSEEEADEEDEALFGQDNRRCTFHEYEIERTAGRKHRS